MLKCSWKTNNSHSVLLVCWSAAGKQTTVTLCYWYVEVQLVNKQQSLCVTGMLKCSWKTNNSHSVLLVCWSAAGKQTTVTLCYWCVEVQLENKQQSLCVTGMLKCSWKTNNSHSVLLVCWSAAGKQTTVTLCYWYVLRFNAKTSRNSIKIFTIFNTYLHLKGNLFKSIILCYMRGRELIYTVVKQIVQKSISIYVLSIIVLSIIVSESLASTFFWLFIEHI